MAISQFSNPNYQRVYEAGMARLSEIERQKRAMATNVAARGGVKTSGVSMIPQGEISRGAVMAESQLGSDVAMQAEEERLALQRFEQQKELFGLQEAAALRLEDLAYQREKKRQKAGGVGRVVGGVVGGAAGLYFGGPAGATAGSQIGSQLGGNIR